MSGMTLLLGLLVLAYVGSMLMGGRALRGYGLPSGSEWLVCGFVLGPQVFGVVSRDALQVFEPLVGVSMAWLALVTGAEYGFAGKRRVRLRGFVIGIACALLTTFVIGSAVYAIALHQLHMLSRDALIMAAALGLAGSETTRHAVRWVAEESGAHGSLLGLCEDIADTDEIVPLLGLAVVFAAAPSQVAVVRLTLPIWFGLTLGLGLLSGLACALLLRSNQSAGAGIGVLIGAALLGTGIAWRLGLSPLTAMFVMGVSLSASSRHAQELRELLARTEPAVLVPTLLLAGGSLQIGTTPRFWLVVVAAILGRAIGRCAIGQLVAIGSRAPSAARWPLSFGLWSTGALTVLIGLACAFRFRGELGQTVLGGVVCMTLVGELIGPTALRRALVASSQASSPSDEPKPLAS